MKTEQSYVLLSPTDLANHTSCRHLTNLELKAARGEINRIYVNDPSLDLLRQRGQQHEDQYVEYLQKQGLRVINLKGKNFTDTLEAMKAGYDVLVQARLEDGNWRGYADIILKVTESSDLGTWSYEVQDTKLSEHTRSSAVLQLCFYSEVVSKIQGRQPEFMRVIKPGNPFETDSFRFNDFKSYFSLVKKSLQHNVEHPSETYPEPVEHCNICSWWLRCNAQRHDDDHLSLVAGIRKSHIRELEKQSINTLEGFALAKKIRKPERGNLESLLSRQAQAKIQYKGKQENAIILHELLDAAEGRGLSRLPEPSEGDIYFDIEGDPFYEHGGLEYLLGYVYKDQKKGWIYEKLWARNHAEEKRAFEKFIDFVMKRIKKSPDLCIYHYAPYEPSAIKRMMLKHAVCDQEVDRLLRGLRFVDLHSIIKETLIASVERYSLKDLEKLPGYTRNIPLRDAGPARRNVECALELNEADKLPQATLDTLVGYNEDDCRATLALHQWLEQQREVEIKAGKTIPRLEINDGKAGEEVEEAETRSRKLFKSLTADLPEDRQFWSTQDKAKWLLAHQIDYFRREEKITWWEFFRLHELTEHEELLDERKAITGLQFIGALPLKGKERTPIHSYSFPHQEIGIKAGDEIIEILGDKIGNAVAVYPAQLKIDIKKTTKSANIHPSMIHVKEGVSSRKLANSLLNLAETIVNEGLKPEGSYAASKDLLLGNRPRLKSDQQGKLLKSNEDPVKGAIRLAKDLDNSVLAIQGPPGSGKTYTGARMIIELSKKGKKIGVTAVSHKVIQNLFENVLELAHKERVVVELVHKNKGESEEEFPEGIEAASSNEDAINALQHNKVVGGTAWLWASDEAVGQLDYLFVDEAGQMSLTQVLAASRCARNLILLGDPQQLEQPQKGAHPEGSDVAALTYLLGDNKTMPDDKGLFLGITRRLNPEICSFTSEVFYESRLTSLEGLEQRKLLGKTPFTPGGLFYVPVVHEGNQYRSFEEIDAIDRIVKELIGKGGWTLDKGKSKKITTKDILIVAPYNAQVSALKDRLPGFRVGTVDKFQGQEAAVVIYSMTCSSSEEAPRGMSFLYNPNRLNVASSRAMCACILVCSPMLMEPECKSIEQMKWANALCRYREMAREVDI